DGGRPHTTFKGGVTPQSNTICKLRFDTNDI
ncbi:MAG: hypothetical protein ACJA0I_002125, partial [Gammaproteobacteria bacterium]